MLAAWSTRLEGTYGGMPDSGLGNGGAMASLPERGGPVLLASPKLGSPFWTLLAPQRGPGFSGGVLRFVMV